MSIYAHVVPKVMAANVSQIARAGQNLMLEIQRIIYSREGSVNKIIVDDKVCPARTMPMSSRCTDHKIQYKILVFRSYTKDNFILLHHVPRHSCKWPSIIART